MKWTIRQKLLTGFMVVLALLVAVDVVALVKLHGIAAQVANIDQKYLPRLTYIQNMTSAVWNVDDLVHKYATTTDSTQRQALQSEIDAAMAVEQKNAQALSALLNTASKQIYATFASDWQAYVNDVKLVLGAKDSASAGQALAQAEVDFTNPLNQMNQLVNRVQTLTHQATASARAAAAQVTGFVVTVSLLAIVVGAAVAWALSEIISRGLRQVRDVAVHVAEGNLRVSELRPRSKDEIADLMHATNSMVKQLRSIVATLTDHAQRVAAAAEELFASVEENSRASQQIAGAIETVAAGTERQKTSADESAKAMEDIAKSIESIADKSTRVASASTEMAEAAANGQTLIENSVAQMEVIHASVADSAAKIADLSEQTKRIGDIVAAITNIADQTNLLALNAAIEAARAGEQGRGFAVVADEVRKLAEESARATSEIAAILEGIRRNTEDSVTAMRRVSEEAESGRSVVQEAGASFAQIREAVDRVRDQVLDVSAATEEISAAVEEVTATIESMAQISREAVTESQNVAAAAEEQLASQQEISSAATSLSEMARSMRELVARFQV
ncbi:hypothetical protein GCM10010885_16990 [Alicyclobacillus cellulosilyticus]|uniref:Methyl-accepting chemotaxis protein n=1 Tax=Alicyclobacillus cellulosilyticus TaxID=1003997 RepID=A0A917KDK1_9BACL|nr:methyl-accepting chemotaxis protein [Alicyclobacillus cellulosilyticus]GGJ08471.1 hypothetical protein GCM10010885_16990 [Alicyclobacillus cellulosilyticus]